MARRSFNWQSTIKRWEEAMNMSMIDEQKRCPTCQGRYWNVLHGKWIDTRETTMLVCPTCGHDFSKENIKE